MTSPASSSVFICTPVEDIGICRSLASSLTFKGISRIRRRICRRISEESARATLAEAVISDKSKVIRSFIVLLLIGNNLFLIISILAEFVKRRAEVRLVCHFHRIKLNNYMKNGTNIP